MHHDSGLVGAERLKVKLNVRCIKPCHRFREHADLASAKAHRPCPRQRILQANADPSDQAVDRIVQRRDVHLLDEADLQVVLQAFTDTRQFTPDLDSRRLQNIASAYAGELKNLRRADGSGSKHHVPTGLHHRCLERFIMREVNTRHLERFLFGEHERLDMGVSDDPKVRSGPGRFQESFCA